MDSTLEAVYKSSNRSQEGNQDMYNPSWEKQMIWKQEQEEFDSMPRTEVDELLAHAGYNVRASDLTHVAQRIEVLDALMGSGVSELQNSDTVHYNPSDMMGWLECMLEELGPVPSLQTTDSPSEMESVVTNSQVVSVLSPGASSQVVAGPQQMNNNSTNRPSSSSSSSSYVAPNLIANQLQNPPPTSSEVLIPSIPEEDQQSDELSGVRLVHLLFACANAVQRGDNNAAVEMIQQLRILMNYSAGAMSRVASHFVDALSRRIGGPAPPENSAMDEILHFHFYETCPYLKFAHFTANQAIMEAVAEASSVHVIDLNLHYGLQWPALIQSLAMRPGGPPSLRLTGIGPPQWNNNKDSLQEIGLKLAKLAENLHVDFNFHGVVASRIEEIQPKMLTLRRGDAVVVNSMFQLHKVLGDPDTDSTRWRSSRIDEVLQFVRNLKPAVVTVVEQDADHNSPVFMDRFMSALHYYSTMFDSLDACNLPAGSMERMVVEAYLGKEIGNIIACEGPARIERHETPIQWKNRMVRAGFRPFCLGSNAFNQGNMLLNMFPGGGYRIEEKQGCLTLGWQSRPLVAVSAWQC